jgi:putative membrane protein
MMARTRLGGDRSRHTVRVLIAALVFAALAGLLHVWIFVMESVLFDRPSIHARFAVRSQDVPVVRSWAYNQGFYNLFLGIGALVGVVVAASGQHGVGLALVLASCGSMLAAAVVLVASQRTMARAAAAQGTLPLLAVLAAVVAVLS